MKFIKENKIIQSGTEGFELTAVKVLQPKCLKQNREEEHLQ